jgi:hypothetical protein
VAAGGWRSGRSYATPVVRTEPLSISIVAPFFFSCTHHSHTEYRNAPEIRADSVLYYNVWNSLGLMALPHFASIALIVTTISAIFGVDIT